MTRVFGFEIMPAPFVIAHLQLGLFLHHAGAPFSEVAGERAAVYLTNALTGWEKPHDHAHRLPFPELEDERDAAEKVKRDLPILVILGNPPYNIYASVAVNEERGLTDAYRSVREVAPPQGRGLNDLYVRFFRMAERRIVEATGQGVICFISNYSWLDGLSFTGMRERFLDVFDSIWIDCLNGDKYKTGKLTPAGDPDPSIFSTERNREGIQVGTAITLLARREAHEPARSVHFRHLWGKKKSEELIATAQQSGMALYENVTPPVELGLPFVPGVSNFDYAAWPTLPDLLPVSFPGVITARDAFVVDIDRTRLVDRVQSYFDPEVTDEVMKLIEPSAMANASRFDARATRAKLLARGFLSSNVVRFAYRPFDMRWLYWEPDTKLLHEKRAEYFAHVSDENVWLEARQRQSKDQFDRGYVTRQIADNFGAGISSFFPLFLEETQEPTLLQPLLEPPSRFRPNLTSGARRYLEQFGLNPADLFHHAVAILRTPTFSRDNAAALRQDWPRIPLPDSRDALLASADLGRQIAELFDTERDVPGVTSGVVRPELRSVGAVSRAGGGALNPEAGDLAVIAGWGHQGKGGITMPGKGRIAERDYSFGELDALRVGAEALNLTSGEALVHLGVATRDVYLNDVAYWRNVPAGVWSYTVGGYQVIKKWLSYRERSLLGRDLSKVEVREVTNMARRLAAILLLEPALDSSYEAVKASTWSWNHQ